MDSEGFVAGPQRRNGLNSGRDKTTEEWFVHL